MSQTPGAFRPNELADADREPSDAELATVWSMARELEAALPPETIGPSSGFADAVMAAVALEPSPRRAGFLAAFRARPGLAGLATSVRDAWTVASGGPGRPAGARGFALAYVLAVLVVGASFTGVAAYGAAGALGFLDDDRSPSPSLEDQSPTPSLSPLLEPSRAPDASTEPEPSESAEPSENGEPESSDDGSPTPRASSSSGSAASPKASDDHGGSSPSPSDDDHSSPKPSRTPHPSETASPSESHD